MVFTAAQATMIFTDPNYIGLGEETRAHLVDEGVTSVESIGNFHPEDVKELAQTMCRPGGDNQPLPFGAMTQKKFNDTAELIRFYESTGRTMTPAMLSGKPSERTLASNGNHLPRDRKRRKQKCQH